MKKDKMNLSIYPPRNQILDIAKGLGIFISSIRSLYKCQ